MALGLLTYLAALRTQTTVALFVTNAKSFGAGISMWVTFKGVESALLQLEALYLHIQELGL